MSQKGGTSRVRRASRDTRVYAPQIRARLGTTAHFCKEVECAMGTKRGGSRARRASRDVPSSASRCWSLITSSDTRVYEPYIRARDTRVYEPYTRARLGTTAHFCKGGDLAGAARLAR